MSNAAFTLAYDGPSLRDGAMDVRDLAPALLAVGRLFDAANSTLNGDNARVSVQVTATDQASFDIFFQVYQTLADKFVGALVGEGVTAALNLRDLLLTGTGGVLGLLWLIRKLRGRHPDKVERITDGHFRLTVGDDVFDIPLKLLRLYQDIAVRSAVQQVVEEPLRSDGIDKFEIKEGMTPLITITKDEAHYFKAPELPDETLTEHSRRSAFSIISLAFKDDNKWRLFDGNTQISAPIEDAAFLARVDANQVSFSKGDILLCDVKITQRRTTTGLKTDYVVVHVADHKPAARQLPLPFEPGSKPPAI